MHDAFIIMENKKNDNIRLGYPETVFQVKLRGNLVYYIRLHIPVTY